MASASLGRSPPTKSRSPRHLRWLQIAENDEIFRCERIRTFNDRPFMVETVAMPKALLPLLTKGDFGRPRTTFFVARRHKLLVDKAEERIDIGIADEKDARALGIATGIPCYASIDCSIRTRGFRWNDDWRVAIFKANITWLT